ncbi:hypothetical protein GCM10011506_12170 [Marivirga lumbricoides]|uniref:Glycosyltransferase RgtA/B/C/D-like domain-containing protein n=2 Tax=Marivirga lumbricoides TaxID=1046115 RepID=A0ABQ1LST4_9BACT|nr:hypothetical protein GCM10011506_12170 [Marivirga lumbricoides]
MAVIDKMMPVRRGRNKFSLPNHSANDNKFLKKLFWYHLLLSFVYYIYSVFNRSDSHFYYEKIVTGFRGPDWSSFYGTSTTFIEWTGYPFIKWLGFSFEAIMALFAFFGFLGFIYFYRFFRERIFFKNTYAGFDLLHLFFLLPNLHFWSGSFGKGAFIFLGIGLLFYGLNNIPKRYWVLLIGALLTYHIRPHILLVILASSLIGFTFSSKGVGWGVKIVMILIAAMALGFIYKDVLNMVGLETDTVLTEGLNMSNRAAELSKATSGLDITTMSLPMQVFTFLFRPLFFDAPGMLGIIVSFENVFLLFITLIFLFKGGILYIIKGDFAVKTAFFSFITVSIALAQISGNLGIAIRQKSQIMMLFLFIIIQMYDDKKKEVFKSRRKTVNQRETLIRE